MNYIILNIKVNHWQLSKLRRTSTKCKTLLNQLDLVSRGVSLSVAISVLYTKQIQLGTVSHTLGWRVPFILYVIHLKVHSDDLLGEVTLAMMRRVAPGYYTTHIDQFL